jgi:hypothetical protein
MTIAVSVVVSNYLPEDDIMNSHISESIANEKNMDMLRSIEFFVAMVVAISMVALAFFAAV